MCDGQDEDADLYPACGADGCPLALMESAEEDLISCESSKDKATSRFASPRSDLFRHHMCINLRNLLATTPPWSVDLLRGVRHVTGLIRTSVGKQRPDRACHLVC